MRIGAKIADALAPIKPLPNPAAIPPRTQTTIVNAVIERHPPPKQPMRGPLNAR